MHFQLISYCVCNRECRQPHAPLGRIEWQGDGKKPARHRYEWDRVGSGRVVGKTIYWDCSASSHLAITEMNPFSRFIRRFISYFWRCDPKGTTPVRNDLYVQFTPVPHSLAATLPRCCVDANCKLWNRKSNIKEIIAFGLHLRWFSFILSTIRHAPNRPHTNTLRP